MKTTYNQGPLFAEAQYKLLFQTVSVILSFRNAREKMFQKWQFSQHLWFTPAILATQEAESKRILVPSQCGQIG
jgi:hypothetical protein